MSNVKFKTERQTQMPNSNGNLSLPSIKFKWKSKFSKHQIQMEIEVFRASNSNGNRSFPNIKFKWKSKFSEHPIQIQMSNAKHPSQISNSNAESKHIKPSNLIIKQTQIRTSNSNANLILLCAKLPISSPISFLFKERKQVNSGSVVRALALRSI
jgi:hypothetical protein